MDPFSSKPTELNSPLRDFFAITPSDDTDLPTAARGILVGVSGDVAVIGVGGSSSVVIPALAAGVWHPMNVKRVLSTGTTATGIRGGI